MPLCEECEKPGEHRCAGCGQSHYCSKECQKKGWTIHKYLCKSFKDFQDRPTAENRFEDFSRAIYFHPDENGPRFVWLKYSTSCGYLSTQKTDFLSNTEAESAQDIDVEKSEFTHNRVLNRDIGCTIVEVHRGRFLYDGSKPNMAIKRVTNRFSKYLHDWKGPLIAYGTETVPPNRINRDPMTAVDLGPAHLRHIADYFNTYLFRGTNAQLRRQLDAAKGSMVMGVRINCGGDWKIGKRPKFEPISIADTHNIFGATPTPISVRIEMPILTYKIPGNAAKWADQYANGMRGYCNQPATFLHLGCDPNYVYDENESIFTRHPWGFVPYHWDFEVGSVIVVRQDKKPLLPEHMEALAEFCQFKIGPTFQQQSELELSKDTVLRELTRAKFQEYYDAWRNRQKDERKRGQVSPYDI